MLFFEYSTKVSGQVGNQLKRLTAKGVIEESTSTGERKSLFEFDWGEYISGFVDRLNGEAIWLAKRLGCYTPEQLFAMTVAEYNVLLTHEVKLLKKEQEAAKRK